MAFNLVQFSSVWNAAKKQVSRDTLEQHIPHAKVPGEYVKEIKSFCSNIQHSWKPEQSLLIISFTWILHKRECLGELHQ